MQHLYEVEKYLLFRLEENTLLLEVWTITQPNIQVWQGPECKILRIVDFKTSTDR